MVAQGTKESQGGSRLLVRCRFDGLASRSHPRSVEQLSAAEVPLTVRGFHRGFTSGQTASHPLMTAGSIFMGAVGLGSGLACAIGIPASLVPTYYLMALAGTLGIASINFVGFVIAYGPEEADDGD